MAECIFSKSFILPKGTPFNGSPFLLAFLLQDVCHKIDIIARSIRGVITEIPNPTRQITQYLLQIWHEVRLKFAKTNTVMLAQIGNIQFGGGFPIRGGSRFVSEAKAVEMFPGLRWRVPELSGQREQQAPLI